MSAAKEKWVSRPILGESKAVKDLLGLIGKIAPTKTNVLIVGESGTGKELVARMIHESGPLSGKPFVPVNCGAIPINLIESEMFGHKRGSFTGAVSDKPGLFETANGGTLFLDEVGELPLTMQVKLLRAIQERCFRRVGANEDTKVDVRIIAATNRDLEQGIAQGTFREDLYYRLNVLQIRTPALKDRRGDVLLLARNFLQRYSKQAGKEIKDFSPEAIRALEGYAWPGNIRELENVILRGVTLETSDVFGLTHLPAQVTAASPIQETPPAPGTSSPAGPRLPVADFSKGPIDLDRILADVEKYYLTLALDHSGGVKKRAAELLGITFRSIRYRLAKAGMSEGGDSPEDDPGESD